MRDKVAGALYRMTLGDAMGMPTGLWGGRGIKAFFGRTEGFLDGPAEDDAAFNYKRGQFTDDTGQALILLGSIESTDYKPDTRGTALRMLAWTEKENAFENNILGPTSRMTLASLGDSIQDSRITDKALPNGSAIRIAPVGCLFRPERRGGTTRYVYLVLRATHTSDVTIAGAATTAEAVSSTIVRDDFEKVMEDMFGIEEVGYDMGYETFSPRLGEHLRIGLDIAESYKGDDEGFIHKLYDVMGTGVDIIESIPAALSMTYYTQDPDLSCLLCADVVDDTDTIGAIATAVCGAFAGMRGIKPEYIRTLRQRNDADFDHYIRILEKGRGKFA